MKDILDAILADDARVGDFAALPVPAVLSRNHRARRRGRACSPVRESRDKDPRQSLHLDDVPTPELGPGEALSRSWPRRSTTTPSGPASSSRCRRSPSSAVRAAVAAGQASRPAVPRRRLDLAGVVLRTGPGVHAWKPGDEVVAHCLSVELESPDGHNDTMLDPEQRIWGFETNFGGLAELALVKSNQLMPKPAHLTWEEAAVARAGQLDGVPPAGLAQRRRHEAGRRGADLGRFGRSRLVRDPVRAQRRRDPGLRRLVAGQGRPLPSMGAELIIDRRAEDYRFWKDEHTQDQREWRRFGRPHPRADRRRRPRHRVRAPGPRDVRRIDVRRPQGRHHRDLRIDLGFPARVRQPLPLDEPEADHRLALRQLPGGVGGEPADRQGSGSSHSEQDLPAGRDRAGRLRGSPESAPGQGRGTLLVTGRRARRPR